MPRKYSHQTKRNEWAKSDSFMFGRFTGEFTPAIDISVGFKYFPRHCNHLGEQADSCCSTPWVFPSSPVQTLASWSGHHWSLRRTNLPACLCCLLGLNCSQKLDHLSILENVAFYPGLPSRFCVFVDVDCNQCWSTTRFVIRVAIQTGCNLKANILDFSCHLGNFNFRCGNLTLERPYHNMYGYIGISLCLVISSFSYSIIIWKLRQHQTQSHVQTNAETSPLNVTRYKRAVASALWLQLALITCYLPYEITDIIYNLKDLTPSVFLAAQCGIILIYLNSALNPILYCWKIAEVRQAVKDTLRKWCC